MILIESGFLIANILKFTWTILRKIHNLIQFFRPKILSYEIGFSTQDILDLFKVFFESYLKTWFSLKMAFWSRIFLNSLEQFLRKKFKFNFSYLKSCPMKSVSKREISLTCSKYLLSLILKHDSHWKWLFDREYLKFTLNNFEKKFWFNFSHLK